MDATSLRFHSTKHNGIRHADTPVLSVKAPREHASISVSIDRRAFVPYHALIRSMLSHGQSMIRSSLPVEGLPKPAHGHIPQDADLDVGPREPHGQLPAGVHAVPAREVGSGPSVGAGGKVEGKRGGPGLYMIEPSGMYWGYYGAATGKGRQAAKAELEKLNLADGKLDLKQAVKEAARIIYVAQQDNKDKEFELEMSWISNADGPTKGRHMGGSQGLFEEAERLAKKAISEDDEEDEDEDEKEDDKMEE
ncbi:hypothetical protein NUW58_g1411 [Xylaria curta]|uniref:Uncharacterized protein n=1 Tax=Xylaria curta TaxID=42375 RepID=A0ACC1PMW1_9PEZI|nr:hypothetical protein NUW58_g1411 [Xylaria curta]